MIYRDSKVAFEPFQNSPHLALDIDVFRHEMKKRCSMELVETIETSESPDRFGLCTSRHQRVN
jgi:hypothetical protein